MAVVVTGAARGIGRAIAQRFATEGHLVVVADIDKSGAQQVAAELRSHGYEALEAVVDVGDRTSVEELGQLLTDQLEQLDAVVNNAGLGANAPFFELPNTDWQRVLDVDLTGPFMVSRTCWPLLRKPGGAIVHVSSIHGSRALPGQAAYAAAKGGLNTMTRAMAIDAAPHGIRVNAVAPGFIRTVPWHEWLSDAPEARRRARRRDIERIVPQGRPGVPEEVAGVVSWLASPDATYVTGTVVEADGGLAGTAYRFTGEVTPGTGDEGER